MRAGIGFSIDVDNCQPTHTPLWTVVMALDPTMYIPRRLGPQHAFRVTFQVRMAVGLGSLLFEHPMPGGNLGFSFWQRSGNSQNKHTPFPKL